MFAYRIDSRWFAPLASSNLDRKSIIILGARINERHIGTRRHLADRVLVCNGLALQRKRCHVDDPIRRKYRQAAWNLPSVWTALTSVRSGVSSRAGFVSFDTDLGAYIKSESDSRLLVPFSKRSTTFNDSVRQRDSKSPKFRRCENAKPSMAIEMSSPCSSLTSCTISSWPLATSP